MRQDGSIFEAHSSHVMLKNIHGESEFYNLDVDLTALNQVKKNLQKSIQNLKRILEGTVLALMSAVEMRDPYTAGHQNGVAKLACAIASELGLDENRIEGLRIGSLLHDIGKLNIPSEILTKPGGLSDIEYKLMQTHPQFGFEILRSINFPWPIAQMVLQHHEKIDGSGYPQGLMGEKITLEARIITVADVVEPMSSHRPYRPALGMDAALAEIKKGKGTCYDNQVVEACVKIIEEKGFQFRSSSR
jgi:putative nucleotidyltransferase with HDIG domain